MSAKGQKIVVWLDGELLPPEEATINVLSPTSMYGLNVFETIRGYMVGDAPLLFRVHDHVDRLMQSARIIDLPCPYAADEILRAIHTTLEACAFREDLSARIVLYFDEPGSWSARDGVKLLVSPVASGRAFTSPVACCVSSWTRIGDNSLPPRAKVGANYMSTRLAQLEAVRGGYDVPVLLNERGTVAEAPGACFFLVRGGRLVTPPLHASILESITRSTVIELAEAAGIDVEIREIDRTELYCGEEAFLCGTSMEITPIARIDHHALRTGDGSPITRDLTLSYFEAARGKSDRYRHWVAELSSLCS